jgi:hypothetical protein
VACGVATERQQESMSMRDMTGGHVWPAVSRERDHARRAVIDFAALEAPMIHPDISRAIMNDRVKRFRDKAKTARRAAKAKGHKR